MQNFKIGDKVKVIKTDKNLYLTPTLEEYYSCFIGKVGTIDYTCGQSFYININGSQLPFVSTEIELIKTDKEKICKINSNLAIK